MRPEGGDGGGLESTGGMRMETVGTASGEAPVGAEVGESAGPLERKRAIAAEPSSGSGGGGRGPRVVVTFGTFDVLHVGHVSILERARALGDRLVVGVSSDALNVEKKGRPPVYPEDDRLRLVAALRCVDEVFVEESLALKGEYLKRFGAAVMVMGDDWRGRFDTFAAICEVVYLPRTPSISTTEIIEVIRRVG